MHLEFEIVAKAVHFFNIRTYERICISQSILVTEAAPWNLATNCVCERVYAMHQEKDYDLFKMFSMA